MSHKQVSRGTSPVPFEKYDAIKAGLNDGQYAVVNQLPPHNALNQYQPPNHFLRNLGIIGGLGAGIGAAMRYRQPLMKLGQKAINYVSDKFHNLYNPTNETAITPNPHNG